MGAFFVMLTLAASVGAWFMLSIAVGVAASRRCNRDGFAWFVFALVFSPLIAAALLYALGYNDRKRNPATRAIAVIVVGVAILFALSASRWCGVLGVCIVSSAHAQQTTVRDASGNTVGTITTDSAGTRTFRDSSGNTTGTATRDSAGTTTFRDSRGRTTGTASGPRR
jgi:hypothetical protein